MIYSKSGDQGEHGPEQDGERVLIPSLCGDDGSSPFSVLQLCHECIQLCGVA